LAQILVFSIFAFFLFFCCLPEFANIFLAGFLS
jgi:hypothetical protein